MDARIIRLEQGSPAWRDWRWNGIGGSDIAAILGESPFVSYAELFMEKVHRGEPRESTFAMRRGTRLEPEARDHYRQAHKIPVEPVCLERPEPENAWMKSSLDGHWGELALEIKCPNWKDHDYALNGGIPPYYKPQCQWILLVSGCELLHYYSYNPGKRFRLEQRGALVEVLPDPEEQARLHTAAERCWKAVLAARSEQRIAV